MKLCLFPIILLSGVLISLTNTQAGMIDKNGMQPWEICGLCHSLDGISHMAKFPKLAGQKASYIEKQLRDFKSGLRKNDGGQMEAIVNEVAEQDIPSIATYFASLKPPGVAALSDDTPDLAQAEKLYKQGDQIRSIPSCVSCHEKNNKQYGYAPELRTQHEAYIRKQLADFKSSGRTNDNNEVMRKIANLLTDKDIENLARFLSQQKR